VSRLEGVSTEKLRGFFVDLYADLRDRRLLPLVALLIVGIVAAPILLKSKGETAPPAPPPVSGAASSSDTSFSVVPAQQELQARKRLGRRTAKDPFEPPATASAKEEASGGESPSPAGAPPARSSSNSVTVTEEKTTETTTTPGPVRYVPVAVTFGIDAMLGAPGHTHKDKAIRPQAKLPSAKNPVLVYMGPSKDRKHALFLPSSQVLAYTGPVHCAAEKADCQLLEVGLGAPVDFVYGVKEQHFDLTVERFVPILLLPHGKERVLSTHR
jgi:hypothetical protein